MHASYTNLLGNVAIKETNKVILLALWSLLTCRHYCIRDTSKYLSNEIIVK